MAGHGTRHYIAHRRVCDVMRYRIGAGLCALLLAGCAAIQTGEQSNSPPASSGPDPDALLVNCGGPGFPAAILEQPGRAETIDDPAAAALRRHLVEPGADYDWLPDAGWREVARTETEVTYVADAAPGSDPPYAVVTVVRDGGRWSVAGWAQCRLQPDVEPGLGLASFRVDPGLELTAALSEIPVLVTERACNSGQNARGRIVEPEIVLSESAVSVVFAVRPRPGGQDCPSNPETPHLLSLPEPLGERTLLDESEIPPRDATQCADAGACPP